MKYTTARSILRLWRVKKRVSSFKTSTKTHTATAQDNQDSKPSKKDKKSKAIITITVNTPPKKVDIKSGPGLSNESVSSRDLPKLPTIQSIFPLARTNIESKYV